MEANSKALRYIAIITRTLMGLLFIMAGSNFFFHFMPEPTEPMSEGATALMGGFMKSGYMFPLIGATQLVAGVLLVAGRFVPLALVIIAPVIVNIFAMHLFLAPEGLGMAIALVLIELYLAWYYRDAFRRLFI